MNTITLFDYNFNNLKPLTYTRSVSDLRVGITTIKEKWNLLSDFEIEIITADYLQKKYSPSSGEKSIFINSSYVPTDNTIERIIDLSNNKKTLYFYNNEPLVFCGSYNDYQNVINGNYSAFSEKKEIDFDISFIKYPWNIFSNNGKIIESDFRVITNGKKNYKDQHNFVVIGDENQLFIDKNATVLNASFNTTSGPIYIGSNATIMEGCFIRGGFALCDNATLKMCSKIYGPTTIGPYSKMGGEINNSVIQAFSNKGHEGFLGNAVIGEWCNLGADTNNSNLKNNYSEVRQWNYVKKSFIPTGLQFSGLVMGDHSKTAINTMFNTGSVVGVSSNIYGAEFPRKFIPSFSWGSTKGYTTYKIENAIETAEKVMLRRNISLTDEDKEIMQAIFEITSEFRKFY